MTHHLELSSHNLQVLIDMYFVFHSYIGHGSLFCHFPLVHVSVSLRARARFEITEKVLWRTPISPTGILLSSPTHIDTRTGVVALASGLRSRRTCKIVVEYLILTK